MGHSLLEKITSGRKIGRENKQVVKSLFLCNLSHKAALPLLKYEAGKFGVYLDFMEADYSDFLSFVQLNQNAIVEFQPELIFILFDENYYLNEYGICKSIEQIKLNIEDIKKCILFLFQVFARHEMQRTNFIISSLPYHKIYFNQYISLDDRNTINEMISGFYKHLWDEHKHGTVQLDTVDLSEFHGKVIEDIYVEKNTVASLDFLNHFSETASKYLRFHYGKTIKCIITDLDNTLWHGVLADEGIENSFSDKNKGLFQMYQQWLSKLYDQGVILSIVSKNDEDFIKSVFKNHQNELCIQWDKFVYPEINWDKKSTNIRKICNNLNISPEHVLFIDDNVFECEEVRHNIPQINVFQFLPDIKEDFNKLLQADFFVKQTITAEDKLRNANFSQNILRDKIRTESVDNDDFLKRLKIRLFFTDQFEHHIQRISDLTLKTNQFNLTTIRMDVKGVQVFMEQQGNRILVFSCQDQLGEYGVIGCAFITLAKETCTIHNMILSCRVFERQIEFGMMDVIAQYARKHECRNITGTYKTTNKNKKFGDYYERCGFRQISQGFFQADLDTLRINDKHLYVELKEMNDGNK